MRSGDVVTLYGDRELGVVMYKSGGPTRLNDPFAIFKVLFISNGIIECESCGMKRVGTLNSVLHKDLLSAILSCSDVNLNLFASEYSKNPQKDDVIINKILDFQIFS